MKTEITPLMAEDMLERNKVNRPISEPLIRFLANEMKLGNFKYNGETIIIGDDGSLMDGQHRLMSCVKANVTIVSELVVGVNNELMPTIDTGKPRSGADVLCMAGIKNNCLMAGFIRLLYNFERKRIGAAGRGTTAITNTQILHEAQTHNYQDWMITDAPFPGMTKGDSTFINYVVKHIDEEFGEEFMEMLIKGIGLTDGSPVLTLRNQLLKDLSAPKRMSKNNKYAICFRAFEKFMQGARVTRGYIGIYQGSFPYPENYPFYK